jgi:hypothetical protein
MCKLIALKVLNSSWPCWGITDLQIVEALHQHVMIKSIRMIEVVSYDKGAKVRG